MDMRKGEARVNQTCMREQIVACTGEQGEKGGSVALLKGAVRPA